jgi:hypothetical protein
VRQVAGVRTYYAIVMLALGASIHDFFGRAGSSRWSEKKTWMPVTSTGMTTE